MEIPQNIQDRIKCSECDELLSCGPVFLVHKTGGTICGRCSHEEEEGEEMNERTRNDPYEATASLLLFPCAFTPRGCREKVPFSLGQPAHESNCEFRPFICPVVERGTCDWIGSSRTLREHCRHAHPTHLFENPCLVPRPDLTHSHLVNYIISAFHLLFLVHLKVCVSSGKLFHSVRLFGENKFLDMFSYTLEVEGNNNKVTQSGSVLRAGIMTIQEPTSISTTINSLLDILGGKYEESKFIISIKTGLLTCGSCLKTVRCDECKETFEKCQFHEQGCSFVDVNEKKCDKHEILFCKYQTKCCLMNCGVNIDSGSLIEHLSSSTSCYPNPIKSNINSVVRLTKNINKKNFIIFSSNNIGTIICQYDLSCSQFDLYLYSSLPFYELKNLKCSIELTDPQTKHSELLTPQIVNNEKHDWSIKVEMNNFPSWENVGLNMKLIIK